MSESRTRILSRLRAQAVQDVALPAAQGGWIRFTDRAAKFVESVAQVGGRAEMLGQRPLAHAVSDLPVVRDARRVCSLVPGIAGNVDLDTVPSPHTLADLDVTVVQGDLAVAENGAVWVTDRALRHRAVLFIPQHLILVVEGGNLVDNMHQAYETIGFASIGFGVFISGPSKTADIEQSLVIGAHGPRSATIFVTGGNA